MKRSVVIAGVAFVAGVVATYAAFAVALDSAEPRRADDRL